MNGPLETLSSSFEFSYGIESTKLCSTVQVNLCQKLLFLQNKGRTCCVHRLFWILKAISVHNMFSPCIELGIFTHWNCKSMNNLSSYCGLVDTKIRPSDKDLPVLSCGLISAFALFVLRKNLTILGAMVNKQRNTSVE